VAEEDQKSSFGGAVLSGRSAGDGCGYKAK
jgi:hypothetical protein